MMGRVAVSGLRSRLVGVVGAVVALMAAAALLTACGLLFQTGLLGTVATQRYAGTPVLVSASQNLHFAKSNGKVKSKPLTEHAWLDAGVLPRLAGLPGTRSAVGELSFAAAIVDPGGVPHAQSWGHGWGSAALTPFTLRLGRPPRSGDEVVLGAGTGLGVGSPVVVQTAAGRSTYTVVGITHQTLADQDALFFSDATARRLAGHPGQVFALALPHATPADLPALRKALTGSGAVVVTGSARGLLEFTGAARAKATLISLSAVLGGTALLVAMVVVAASFALSIGHRRRELALLRAIGATPRQVRRMLGVEAVLVALLAAPLGALAGDQTAVWLRVRFIAAGATPRNLPLVNGPAPAAIAIVLTLIGAWIAARVCARRTTRIQPIQALVEAAVPAVRLRGFRLVAGVGCVAGFFTLLTVLTHLHTDAAASPLTLVATLLAVLAMALLGPGIAAASSAALALPVRLLGGRTGRLAAANNLANPQRLASVLTPLTLAVAISGTIAFAPATLQHAAGAQQKADLTANAVVISTGVGLTADAVRRVSDAPGVSAANAELRTVVRRGKTRYAATGMTGSAITHTVDLHVRSGSLDDLRADGVALSTAAAGSHRVGDHLTLSLGDGTTATLVITAVYASGLAFGDMILPLPLVASHVDSPFINDVLVRTSSPAALTGALGDSGGRVVTASAFGTVTSRSARMNADIGYLALGLIVAFAGLAVLNSLAMATGARTREFAGLRLVGMQRRQVAHMVNLETVALAATGLAAGTAIGYGVLAAYSRGMTGGHSPYTPALAVAAIAVAVAALAAAATTVPVRLCLRARPADAINERQ